MDNVDKRLSRLEKGKQETSLFEAYSTYVLVDTREKYLHPERFKEVFDYKDETGKHYKMVRNESE